MKEKIAFKQNILLIAFVIVEVLLYYFILTSRGNTLVACSFASIVLCFVYALLNVKRHNVLWVIALGCTVAADFFLVICTPIQRLWGMVFFLAAQCLYAAAIHIKRKSKNLMIVRLVLTTVAVLITVSVLKGETDVLSIVSLCYYANLIMNLIMAVMLYKWNKLLPWAFVLFVLCDTVVGLQVASELYVEAINGTFIHDIIFCGFNLSWLFYLPSQVLLALSVRRK